MTTSESAAGRLIRVDFHAHTNYSLDSLIDVRQLGQAIDAAGLDKLAVTDHNEISGALRARELYGERIIVGEEVKTKQGEILVLYLTQLIPAHLDAAEALARATDQGAFVCPAHPFDTRRGGWQLADLEQYAEAFDAIEGFNGRNLNPQLNEQAQTFAREHGLPVLAGSDSHSLGEIGRVFTTLPAFHDADSLRNSIVRAEIAGQPAPVNVLFKSIRARLINRLRRAAD